MELTSLGRFFMRRRAYRARVDLFRIEISGEVHLDLEERQAFYKVRQVLHGVERDRRWSTRQ